MKILMVNNRLKVYGGEGTYMTSVGDQLIALGHDVQYFGLKDPDNKHGNRFNIYAKKSKNPFRMIKNNYNKHQFSKILDLFKPDVVHVNLIYFTLTPSILEEAKKRRIKIVQTIHDGKMICPSYQLFINNRNMPCTLCLNGDFKQCVKNRCHKNSFLSSYIAYREATYNKKKKYYDLIDTFIFPSQFMRDLHVTFGLEQEKTKVLCNFSRLQKRQTIYEKSNYVLFFGRVTKVKGVDLIAEAAKMLPNIEFKVVGDGDMISLFKDIKNVHCLGFKNGQELENIIAGALCTLFPSIWLENCPMSIQESIAMGTPVIGANIGGIPELIDSGKTGFLFESNNITDFIDKIKKIVCDDEGRRKMEIECINSSSLLSLEEYTEKYLGIIG